MDGMIMRAVVGALLAGGTLGCGMAVPRRAPDPLPLPTFAASRGDARTALMRGEELVLARQRVRAGDASLLPAFQQLMRDADSALAMASVSVTQKTLLPPSGSRHDFQSFGPYWWPDTTKPGGLPYVRRDGVVNPASRVDHDGWRMARMSSAVEALALAHWFTDDERYARRAVEHVRVFFLDSATAMRPHLQYAQAIPGVSPGRGIGILDSRHLVPLSDALRLLERSPAYTAADRAGMRRWLRSYLDWLLTSENGRDEEDEPNNHGTFYDMQVVAIALQVGDTAQARRTLARTRERIAHHVATDGSQPLELARTRPLHYSVFNLEAFTTLAELARSAGVDLWGYTAPDGGSIAKALRFVAPYADTARTAPWKDISPVARDLWLLPMRRAALATGDPAFTAALRTLPADLLRTDRSRLSFVTVP